MTTTPRLSNSWSQANTTHQPAPMSAGLPSQDDGQVVALNDGGYVVVWTDFSRTYNSAGAAVIGQRYDSAGNKVGGEVKLSGFNSGDQFSPAVTRLDNGNIAVAFVDQFGGDDDIYVRIFDSSLSPVRTDEIDTGANQTFNPVDHRLRRQQLRDLLHGGDGGGHRGRRAHREPHRDRGRPVRYR
jgi:hypothetical protein